jgi:hypothetical protein
MNNSNGGPLYICFNQLGSNVQQMYYGQYRDLAASWTFFQRVELYNSNVSTQRGMGSQTATYYQFVDNEELTLYRQGASLYTYYLGYSTFVQKN